MVEDRPNWRTGKTFARFRDPVGNVLGVHQQPGLAEMEAEHA